jgi:predicted AlkP superfamily phosphohydrolase/phosphomutase
MRWVLKQYKRARMRSAPALVSAAASGAAEGVLPPWTPGVGWLAVAAGLSAGEMRIVWFRGNITNVMAVVHRSTTAMVAISRAGSRRDGW